MKKRRFFSRLPVVLFLLLLLVPAALLMAHPHVFIESRMALKSNGSQVQGITVIWTFDEMFSSQIFQACDTDKNGKISSQESALVKKKFFKNLENYGYFTYIWINKDQKKQFKIRNFKAYAVPGKKIEYRFFIPLSVPLQGKITVKLMYRDKTNFVAFMAPSGAISFEGSRPNVIKARNNQKAQYQVVVSGS